MTADTIRTASSLRLLYFVRFGFAIIWAALLATTATELGLLATVLLVIYPAFDVAAAIYDARSTRSPELVFNIVVSSLTTIGLGIATQDGIPAVLAVWGIWAILAGIVQLVVALRRRRLGGQWAMILSGGFSAVAGVNFILTASSDNPSMASNAAYAAVGGVFFLISALRLGRSAGKAGNL